jgi:methionyl-tRNA formyltransferase
MSDPRRFAFLVLDEHPYGREMLRRLLARDLAPAAIVVEASELADLERRKFLDRLGRHEAAPPIARQATEAGVPIHRVAAHTDRHCLETLRCVDPHLLVLGGTRILRGALLELAGDGVLNAHQGLLPECRGSASPAWSILHDLPVGASCHFCSEAIDEGDVVGRREVPVRRGATYEDLCHLTLVEAGRLMSEAVGAWREGRLEALRRPQGPSPHPTFRNMPEELLEVVRRKLREQTWPRYVD